jgi:hypothetical protein
MAEGEIINRVANSPLKTFSLEDYLPARSASFDLSTLLEEGILLREKAFREAVKNLDLSSFEGLWVRLYLGTDAIVPSWASILLASKINEVALGTIWAKDEESFWSQYYRGILPGIDFSAYENAPVILKGCGDRRVPQDAYVLAVQRLKKVAKKVSYGEACSAVPLQ